MAVPPLYVRVRPRRGSALEGCPRQHFVHRSAALQLAGKYEYFLGQHRSQGEILAFFDLLAQLFQTGASGPNPPDRQVWLKPAVFPRKIVICQFPLDTLLQLLELLRSFTYSDPDRPRSTTMGKSTGSLARELERRHIQHGLLYRLTDSRQLIVGLVAEELQRDVHIGGGDPADFHFAAL